MLLNVVKCILLKTFKWKIRHSINIDLSLYIIYYFYRIYISGIDLLNVYCANETMQF